MSLTTARYTGFAIGVLALAARVLTNFWIQPWAWRLDSDLAVLLYTAPGPLSIAVAVLAYRRILAPLRRPPVWLSIDPGERRFRAPASPYYPGMVGIIDLWLAAGPLPLIARQPEAMQMSMAREPWAGPVALANLAGLVVLAGLAFAVDRPHVLVSADGIRIQRLLRRTELAWQDLAPGWPVGLPGRGGDIRLWRRPAQPGRAPRAVRLPASRLHVDPGVLADVVGHYAEHPGDRAEIGTRAGLDRLRFGTGAARGSGDPIGAGYDTAG